MPYFVYQIAPPWRLTPVRTTNDYRAARALVRELRQGRSEEQVGRYRMIFAANRAEAERLLSTPRDERVIGED